MKRENKSTLVVTVDVKAKKHKIKQAVKKFYDNDMVKVICCSGLMERRGSMFNWLLTLNDALDVANKTEII